MIKLIPNGKGTYLSVGLLVVVTLAKLFNIGVDQLDPKFVEAIQTILAAAVAWYLRRAIANVAK